MGDAETFWWGIVGAMMSYSVVFLTPNIPALLAEDLELRPRRIFLFGLVMTFLVGLGGLLAVAMGDALQPKHALFYGAGWEGLFKGGVETTRQAVRVARSGQ